MGKLFKKTMKFDPFGPGGPLMHRWAMGDFDGKDSPEFEGIVHNKKSKKDLRAREAAKAGTVFSQASRYSQLTGPPLGAYIQRHHIYTAPDADSCSPSLDTLQTANQATPNVENC